MENVWLKCHKIIPSTKRRTNLWGQTGLNEVKNPLGDGTEKATFNPTNRLDYTDLLTFVQK